MSDTGLAIGLGISRGLEKGTANFVNIMMAKEKNRKENELFGLKKKQANLAIKEAEMKLSPEAAEIFKKQAKIKLDTAELNFQEKEFAIKEAETEATKNQQELVKTQTIGVRSGRIPISSVSPERAAQIISPLSAEQKTAYAEGRFTDKDVATALGSVLGITQAQAIQKDFGFKQTTVRKNTQDELDAISEETSKEDALKYIAKNEQEFKVRGVDVDLLRERANELPPEEERTSFLENLGSIGKGTLDQVLSMLPGGRAVNLGAGSAGVEEKKASEQFKVDQIIERGGKKYKVTKIDEEGPEFEEVL